MRAILVLLAVTGCGSPSATPATSKAVADDHAVFERQARACAANQTTACTDLERACEGKKGAACRLRGELHARAADLKKAAAFYLRGCDHGDARACVARARALDWGRGVARDPAAALAFLERACKADDAEGCVELGRARERGLAGAPDPLLAFDMYRKAARLYEARCEKGDLAACTGLGTLMREGSGVDEDREGGLALQERACRNKHAPACAAWMRRVERGGQRWVEGASARAVLDAACRGGEGTACLVLARVTPEPREDTLQSGCRAGDGGACNALGILRFPPDVPVLERACALGDAPGCFHLALALELPGERQNAERAAALHERSCRWRWGAACTRLGKLVASGEVVAMDAELAARLFRDGCELGSAAGCFELGAMREEGTRVSGDPKEAALLLERACRGGEGHACARMARRLTPELARPLLESACSAGHARSCLELAPLADEAVALQRARDSALPACEAALAFCHDRARPTAKLAWREWADAPARVLFEPPACDERLERACLDAADALSESCRRTDRAHCLGAARLLQRLARAGLGPERAQIDELVRLAVEEAQRGCKRKDKAACENLCALDKRYCR